MATVPDGGAPAVTQEAAAPPPIRLAWVNPARCLPACASEPPDLVRIDQLGSLDPAGAHRVDQTAQPALQALVAAGRAAGYKIYVESAFRSYDEQARLFRTTKQAGRAARPGHSEHQLGTAIDLELPTKGAIAWLAQHAAEHGFVLSYPDGKQRITGYRPEPWHVRFVGALADELQPGAALEELFRERPQLGASGRCADCPLAESRAPCGQMSEAGQCSGTVLTFCYDGSLAIVDCEASKQRCARDAKSANYECI